MPRPKRNRRVFRPPLIGGLLPYGSSAGTAGQLTLLTEEYEAVRLADYEGLSQQESAVQMEISLPTFSRIYETARQKIARALVEGYSLAIEGGSIEFGESWYKCTQCNTAFSLVAKGVPAPACPVCRSHELKEYKGDARQSTADLKPRPAVHQTGYCICPRCGLRVSHQAGVPCRSLICPDCSIPMIREHHPV